MTMCASVRPYWSCPVPADIDHATKPQEVDDAGLRRVTRPRSRSQRASRVSGASIARSRMRSLARAMVSPSIT